MLSMLPYGRRVCSLWLRGVTLTVASALWLIVPIPAVATDWPNWGGPAASGHSDETGLLEAWPAGGPRVCWRRDLGQGYASFAVVNGRAYTAEQDLWGQYLLCLDAETGRTIWRERFAAAYEAAGIYPGPRSTSAIADGRVFLVTPDAVVLAFDAITGAQVWRVETQARFHGAGTEFGYSASPRVLEGKVVLPIGGPNAAVVALDAATGATVWTAGDEPASYCTLQTLTLDGEILLLAYLQNGLLLCRLNDGSVVWREELSHGYDEHSAMPLVVDQEFIISGPFRAGATAYRVSQEPERIHAAIRWSSPKLSNDTASSVVVDGAIYGFDLRDPQAKAHRPSRGEFRCLDWETGAVRWSDTTIGHATVLVADGKLWLFNDRGELIVAHADATAYRELGRGSVFQDEICWTAPALADGRLYLRSMTGAVCLDVRQPVTSETTDAATSGSALTLDDSVQHTRRWRLDWLINGEREHPFMRPTFAELGEWYLWCLATLLPVALVFGVIQFVWPTRAAWWTVGLLILWAGLAFFATPVLNLWGQRFVFTWPATLFATFAGMVCLQLHWHGRVLSWRTAILARLVLFSFALECVGYFWLLRRFSLPHEWVFLLGFPVAWWPTTLVARSARRRGVSLLSLTFWTMAFSIYYWSCGGWHLLQTWLAGRG